MAFVARQSNRVRLLARFLARDMANLVHYGKHAPRAAQVVTFDPRQVRNVYHGSLWEEERPPSFARPPRTTGPALDRYFTGCVRGGDWDLELVPLDECPKQILCVERFRNGKSWESAGAYDLMARILRTRPGADGCHTESDVIRRYQGVDELFAVVASERRLRRQRELNPRNFRELNGVYVHIGRHAEVIFAGGGFHRLAIAQLLGLESIPAQLGVVHEAALRQWKALYARG